MVRGLRFKFSADARQVKKHFSKPAVTKAIHAAVAGAIVGALRVERSAKKRAPVAFGDLRASITHSGVILLARNVFGILVGTNKKYGPFVEFGTGPVARDAALTQEAREFMAATGYQPGGHGGWPPDDVIEDWMKRKKIPLKARFKIQQAIFEKGTKAQPFLFPSLEENKVRIIKDVAAPLRKAVEEGA